MGTYRKAAALGLALGAMACGTKKEQTATLDASLQKDLATVTAPNPGLALAGQGYQRMNYVSAVEQVKPAVPSRHIATTSSPSRSSKRPKKSNPAPAPVAEEVATQDSPSPEPQQTPSAAPAPEPVVVAQQPSPEPTPAPVGNTGEGSAGGRGNRGGGWGGILGGIIGAVVIRGGGVGDDHCDPRTDGRNRGPVYPNIPIARMPVNQGGVFGGHGRH
jgi:outer membrane biosynthesis protein TonB